MATLNITDATIRGSLTKMNSAGIVQPEGRGRHEPKNKMKFSDTEFIKMYLASFPVMESHYVRKSTNKKYFAPGLNLATLYKLYKEMFAKKNRIPGKIERYRTIFKTFHIGFYKPKKDQCMKCLKYKDLCSDEKEISNDEHEQYLSRKDLAREHINNDKETAISNAHLLAFNFDLQAVLYTPKTEAGQIFYKRKLAVYNLTMYNLATKQGTCFTWDETQGQRGTIEISTCLFKYLHMHQEVEEVYMMLDNCGGQNRN
jgi:hypothetical protein